ncbi:MAG: (2Fe-2S) ferredoxin domain-containing protein [Anaerolineales bacterium]|nr:(2Fe-2S) ferredoxin domain-containing protein [Anaerolineales bacterium]
MKSLEDLRHWRGAARQQRQAAPRQTQVRVSMGTSSLAAGARAAWQAIADFVDQQSVRGVQVGQSGGFGLDSWEPVVQVTTPAATDGGEGQTVTYGRVTPDVARRIMREHVVGGRVVTEYVVPAGWR